MFGVWGERCLSRCLEIQHRAVQSSNKLWLTCCHCCAYVSVRLCLCVYVGVGKDMKDAELSVEIYSLVQLNRVSMFS